MIRKDLQMRPLWKRKYSEGYHPIDDYINEYGASYKPLEGIECNL